MDVSSSILTVKIFGKKNSRKFQNTKFEFAVTNYLHSIFSDLYNFYILLGIL